jgi:DNA-binding NtrC family response regulator
MPAERTVPDAAPKLPVRTLRVEVLEGPDAGAAKVAESETLTVGSADGNDLVLKDPMVSRFHATFARCEGGVKITDNGSTNGAFVGAVKVERAIAPPGTTFRVGRTTLRVVDGDAVAIALHTGEALAGLRGRTPTMRRLMASIERAAKSTAPVLAVGESGTGKEVIARALHDLSPRAKEPFVTVDCGSLSPTLVASELFGHERGAFTGAERMHAGAFERAHGGTLFLDEIGELPPALQTSLLGALERRRFRRLGGRTDIAVDLRVVSATNRDLKGEVNRGAFRLDLYYRLAVVVLEVPPLRERTEDIPILVEHFLRESGHAGPVEELIGPQAMAALQGYFWPGNVRELRNMIEATVAMGEPPKLESGAGVATPGAPAAGAATDLIAPLLGQPYGTARGQLLHAFESRYLRDLIERSGGNVSKAARDAKMDRSHLIDLLRRHDIR